MPHTPADFLAHHRGGGLMTELVSQRIGSYFAFAAHRLRLAPTTLTLLNLFLAVGASVGVILSASRIADGTWWIGIAALAAWQIAYALDCADGQLARATGKASPAGGRVDILCDVAVQISLVTAISSVSLAAVEATPNWLVAVFCSTWMVNLMTSILSSGSAAASLITSTSLPVRVIKLIRDFAAMATVVGLVIAFVPTWTPWVMVAFSVTNGGFLIVSIAQAVVASYPGDGKLAVPPGNR